MGIKLITILATIMLSTTIFAGFEWGGSCTSGEGSFEQNISRFAKVKVGVIPAGKRNVKINLMSLVDADIQLYDSETGEAIIDWENGIITESTEVTKEYRGVFYKYSGYNGVNGQYGYEFVEILGDTNRDLVLYAYGYQAGNASIEYSFEATLNCSDIGSGEFSQYIPQNRTVTIGDIPKEKLNLHIELEALNNKDIDIVLIDKLSGEKIISWPNGLLNGATEEEINYKGMIIKYSGYNGINGNLGHETIQITGNTTRELTMKAYGYVAGIAEVKYNWGECPLYQIPMCPNGTYPENISLDNGCTKPVCSTPLAEEGEQCTSDSECQEGLLCSNFNINDVVVGTNIIPFSICQPSWMLNQFASDEVITIQANSSEETEISVTGLATVGMNAIISLKLDLGSNGESILDSLTFEIIAGTTGYDTSFRTSIVDPSKMSIVDGVLKITDLPVSSPGDDSVNGIWKLRITNMNVNGMSVRLRSWRLKASSRMD